jgi:DNA-binding MarR family transcriptional regulator
MQASIARRQRADATAASELARDLFAFVTHLAKRCNPDVFAAFGALELTLTQLKVLHNLERIDAPLTIKEAAELVSISLPAASRALDDLVRRGLVERREDPADRRMKRLALTEVGRATIRRLNASRLNGLEQFAETLTGEERRRLRSALAKLLERPEIAACRLERR